MEITMWQIVGFAGTAIFSARWLYQMWESKKAGAPVVTRGFWYISILGNVLILSYFTFGNPDIVGIVSNLFPMAVSLYNLGLLAARRRQKEKTNDRIVG